ncbi:hypothetical protein M0802_005679 [Mischocyttarus mexicanus]|nr:hypothetical protein M0802_005679 [Mischocyttarus mexicanus]
MFTLAWEIRVLKKRNSLVGLGFVIRAGLVAPVQESRRRPSGRFIAFSANSGDGGGSSGKGPPDIEAHSIQPKESSQKAEMCQDC